MQDFSGVAGRAEFVRLFVGDGRIQIALLHRCTPAMATGTTSRMKLERRSRS